VLTPLQSRSSLVDHGLLWRYGRTDAYGLSGEKLVFVFGTAQELGLATRGDWLLARYRQVSTGRHFAWLKPMSAFVQLQMMKQVQKMDLLLAIA